MDGRLELTDCPSLFEKNAPLCLIMLHPIHEYKSVSSETKKLLALHEIVWIALVKMFTLSMDLRSQSCWCNSRRVFLGSLFILIWRLIPIIENKDMKDQLTFRIWSSAVWASVQEVLVKRFGSTGGEVLTFGKWATAAPSTPWGGCG